MSRIKSLTNKEFREQTAQIMQRAQKESKSDHPQPSFIVAFAGRMGSGKDTAADHLIALAARCGVRVARLSFAGKLRECVEILCGVPAEKTRTIEEKAALVTAKMLGLLASKSDDGTIMNRLVVMAAALSISISDGACAKAAAVLLAATRQTEPLTVGRLLQVLGTEVGRDLLGKNVWVDALISDWKKRGCPAAVITDLRFPNEHEAVMGISGAHSDKKVPGLTYLIDADKRLAAAHETVEAKTGRSAAHASETSLAAIPRDKFTAVITNNGTVDEFKAAIGNIWDTLCDSFSF